MKISCFVFCLVLGVLAVAQAGPPAVKAGSGEPILQELMGGCSLRCGFPWSVEVLADDEQAGAPVKVLNDEQADTAWFAAAGTSGVGVKLKLLFPKKLIAEIEGEIPIYGLDLANGVSKSEDQWKANGRLKKVRLYYKNKAFQEVTFADSRRWQQVTFPDFMVRSGDFMMMEILEIYPGAKSEGAAITEIVLQGAH